MKISNHLGEDGQQNTGRSRVRGDFSKRGGHQADNDQESERRQCREPGHLSAQPL